jgi:hypothetical protein
VESDAPFVRIYQYDQQFRLRVARNPSKSLSQIDGNLWFHFIAKGALGGLATSNQFQPQQLQNVVPIFVQYKRRSIKIFNKHFPCYKISEG